MIKVSLCVGGGRGGARLNLSWSYHEDIQDQDQSNFFCHSREYSSENVDCQSQLKQLYCQIDFKHISDKAKEKFSSESPNLY